MLRLILPPLLSIAVTASAAVKTIKWLDPRKPASAGNTPLHLAAKELPAEAGAEIETRTVKGWSPLDYAASHGGPTMAELLLAYGADINARDDDGWAALHIAARYGTADAIRAPLAVGADIEASTGKGDTPLHMAERDAKLDVVETLLKAGADVRAGDDDGWTALHKATFRDGDGGSSARRRSRPRATGPDEQAVLKAGHGVRGREGNESESARHASLGEAGREGEGGWKVSPGETIGFIAGTALGDRKRYREVMSLNGLSRERPHRRGECLKLQ